MDAFFYSDINGLDDGGVSIRTGPQDSFVGEDGTTAIDGAFTGLKNLTGSLGTLTTRARELGTAVGTVQRQIQGSGAEFTAARRQAVSGDKMGQWWAYASTTDKVLIGLAAVGVAIAAWQTFGGNK